MLVKADADAVAAAVRARVDKAATTALAARGKFALAIPGGSVLQMLAGYESTPEWAAAPADGGAPAVTLAYVNHKCVAMDDAALATHAKARALFLDGWDGVRALELAGSDDTPAEAARYEAALRALPADALPVAADGLPTFDMMLVGVGDDGHVGSLYPNRDECEVAGAGEGTWVLPVDMKSPGGITLSLPVMRAAREVVIAACGVSAKYPQGKSDAMKVAIEGAVALREFPAAGLRPVASWILDEAAASKLAPEYSK